MAAVSAKRSMEHSSSQKYTGGGFSGYSQTESVNATTLQRDTQNSRSLCSVFVVCPIPRGPLSLGPFPVE